MPPQAGGAFAQILAAKRGRFNSQFAEAKTYRPALDAAAFANHLTRVVGPVVERVAAVRPQQAEVVAEALFDLSLDLIGREFLGPTSRYPALADGWTAVFSQLPERLAEAPWVFPGAITNALYNLSATPGARPAEWLQAVVTLSAACDDVPELLAAAQVAAWRAGLAQYRQSALARCRALKPNIAGLALGLPGFKASFVTLKARDQLIDALLADPWLDPAAGAPPTQPSLQISARVGAFRGFGGLFLAPPSVASPGGQFVVTDGDDHWLLFADRFGASLQRVAAPPADKPKMSQPYFQLNLEGQVSKGKLRASFPELARSQSSAANETTLAVTTPLSHAVYLVAVSAA
jgi:hypothetical protein